MKSFYMSQYIQAYKKPEEQRRRLNGLSRRPKMYISRELLTLHTADPNANHMWLLNDGLFSRPEMYMSTKAAHRK
eukprot:5278027-Pleurochrysis_carterae.AAC.1